MNIDNKERNRFGKSNTAQERTDAQIEILFPGQTPGQTPAPEQTPEKKSVCNMIFYIANNGMVLSTTLLISILILLSENFIIGNIQNSTKYLVAKENTNIIMRPLFCLFSYFNMGLLICISRCLGIKDYKGVDHFIKMNFWFLKISSLIIIAVLLLYGWLCGYW